MPLDLQRFISPITSAIGGFIPDEEKRRKLREQAQISIANFVKSLGKESPVSPVSEEETQKVKIQKGVEMGKFVSPVMAKEPAKKPSRAILPEEPPIGVEEPKERPFNKEIEAVFGDLTDEVYEVLKGENATFDIKADNVNKNGTVDRGLFQINDGTYWWMDSSPFYRRQMDKAGIGKGDEGWEDMFDPVLNTKMAKIIYDFHKKATGYGWAGWYGAPAELRGVK